MTDKNFREDVEFLEKHVDVIILSSNDSPAKVAIVPQYQGRVMTSTADGDESFGWLNYGAIASNGIQPHINVYGGEERFWMGPEGGQFAIFFKKGDQFSLDAWQTPAAIDTEPFEVVAASQTQATFTKQAQLTNMSGYSFDIQVDRAITLLDKSVVQNVLGLSIPEDVDIAAFQSYNSLTNNGSSAWTKESGMLSIWLLSMLKPSSSTTVVIPFMAGPESELGPKVSEYFGNVPAGRLVVKDDVLFFSGDGKHRGKIGISPKRAKPVIGSYDAGENVLNLIHYTFDPGATDYVNSMLEIQECPFGGDVVNAYNDGPPEPGRDPLGPFYELETSSPAAALQPGRSIQHCQSSIHLKGAVDRLDVIAQKALGVTLKGISSALSG